MKRYLRCNSAIDVPIILHYHLYPYYGFHENTRNAGFTLDEIIHEFESYRSKITGDIGSRYCALLRYSNISSSEYAEIFFSDSLEECRRVAQNWIAKAENFDYDGSLDAWLSNSHYFVDVVDTETGQCIYYADALQDHSKPWANNL